MPYIGNEGEDLPILFRLWREYDRAKQHAAAEKDNMAAERTSSVVMERIYMGDGNQAPVNPRVVATQVSRRNAVDVEHPVALLDRRENSRNRRTPGAVVTRDASNGATAIDIITVQGMAEGRNGENANNTDASLHGNGEDTRANNLPSRTAPVEGTRVQTRTTIPCPRLGDTFPDTRAIAQGDLVKLMNNLHSQFASMRKLMSLCCTRRHSSSHTLRSMHPTRQRNAPIHRRHARDDIDNDHAEPGKVR